MCGRTRLTASSDAIAAAFGLGEVPNLEQLWNIAPSEMIATIRTPGELEQMRFGLIPSFSTEPKLRWVNVRGETVAKQSAFREAFKSRRCLVIADGFYEWQVVEGEKKKRPFLIRLESGEPFGLAGLWERWTSKTTGEVIDSCAVITRQAEPPLDAIHDRQPSIIHPEDYAAWLDPTSKDAQAILDRARGHAFVTAPVNPAMSNARNKDPEAAAVLEP
jgi:putative SOS response-associated peptidase YedK